MTGDNEDGKGSDGEVGDVEGLFEGFGDFEKELCAGGDLDFLHFYY